MILLVWVDVTRGVRYIAGLMQPPSNTPDSDLQERTGQTLHAHPLELRERGFQFYQKRWTLPQIGEALGVPPATVAGWSMRGKWKRRRADLEKPIKAQERQEAGTSDVLPVSDLAGLSFAEKQERFREESATLALKAIREANRLPGALLIAAADKISKLHQMGQRALDLEKSAPSIVVNVGLLGRALSDKHAERVLLADSARLLPASEAPTYENDTGCEPVTEARERTVDAVELTAKP